MINIMQDKEKQRVIIQGKGDTVAVECSIILSTVIEQLSNGDRELEEEIFNGIIHSVEKVKGYKISERTK